MRRQLNYYFECGLKLNLLNWYLLFGRSLIGIYDCYGWFSLASDCDK